MARSAVRTILVATWALAMLSLSQRATQAKLAGLSKSRPFLTSLMHPAQWEPAGGLLSRTFPATSIDWIRRPAETWTLPGLRVQRQWVRHRGRQHINHQQFTAKTKRHWRRFHLQLDFRFEGEPEPKTGLEQPGNSGIYIFGLYEVQLVDTSRYLAPGRLPDSALRNGMVEITCNGKRISAPANKCLCGSIYGGGRGEERNPMAGAPTDEQGRPFNFCRPSGRWNRLDVLFAPSTFRGGKKTRLATIAVLINGRKVYYGGRSRYGIPQPTGSQRRKPEQPSGPIVIQDHAARVSFRGMVIDSAWEPPEGWPVAAGADEMHGGWAAAVPPPGPKPTAPAG